MLLPINWLKEYVDLDEDIREIADGLTFSGSHVESIIDLDRGVKNIVVGKILEISEHENADKLVVCKIDVGDEVLQIVTGAKNIKEGDLVPVALVGAILADGFKIKKSKLRGVESFGMLCSLEELGYSDNVIPVEAKDGIYILHEDYELGTSLNEVLGLEGHVLEIEITPNRSDCLSIMGLAREAAATFRKEVEEPEIIIEEESGDIEDYLKSVEIKSDRCNRYYTRVIEDVKIEASPVWLQTSLMEAGIRPVNNIVDITNYIMLEYGQPLHAFDLDKVQGHSLIVRQAEDGEKIITLDGAERELDSEDLVIADKSEAIAIAGVMGGLNSEITDETKRVVLESANFDSRSVRLTSKKFNLRSEASIRFEKGLDSNIAKKAGDRFCQLVEEIGAGVVVGGSIDFYENPREAKTISLRPTAVNRRLGTDISDERIIEYLKGLNFEVNTLEDALEVTVPTYRLDLETEVDLIEEVGRLYGFHNIEATPLKGALSQGEKPYSRIIEDKSKDILTGLGLSEILTYSFISPKSYDKIRIEEDSDLRKYIKLINPLGEDYSVMRTSLISNMLETLARNYNRKIESVAFYEIGSIFEPKELPVVNLPKERRRLIIGSYGREDFYGSKEILNILLDRLGIRELEYNRESENPSFHPGRTAKVLSGGDQIGTIGEIHPEVLENYNIGKRVYIIDLDFDLLVEKSNLSKEYKELPKYPAMERDLALVLDKDILSGEVEKLIEGHSKDLIEEIRLFDIYTGDQIPEGKKSIAYSIVYRASDRTLTDKEVNKIQDALIEDLEKTFEAELRS